MSMVNWPDNMPSMLGRIALHFILMSHWYSAAYFHHRLITALQLPGIPPHVDTHSAFEDPILSLSLGSSVVMEFRHQDGRAIPVFLPRRSLLIMSEEARYKHTVTPQVFSAEHAACIHACSGIILWQWNLRIYHQLPQTSTGLSDCAYFNPHLSYSEIFTVLGCYAA